MVNASATKVARYVPRRVDRLCAGIAVLLVVTAFLLPRIMGKQWRDALYAGAAPIFGVWSPHVGWGTAPALAIAAGVVLHGPVLAQRLSWGRLLFTGWIAAMAWAFALAMVDGWQRGFAGRLTTKDEYLHEVGGVGGIRTMVNGFAGRILDFQPDSWTTHVSGHPPGALLVFVLLDRIGLGGGAWAGTLCLLAGTSAVVAVAVTLRALGSELRARAAMPFLVLAPAAIWIAVSADALFAGVGAWAVALLALATRLEKDWPVTALAAGLLFGFTLYLSYGLVLMAIPAAAVLAARSFRPLLPALLGVAVVVAAFTAAGFWWVDGYHLVVERYYQGIASERPYSYWVWANLAATVCAVGLATAAAGYRVGSGLRLLPPRPAMVHRPDGGAPAQGPETDLAAAEPAHRRSTALRTEHRSPRRPTPWDPPGATDAPLPSHTPPKPPTVTAASALDSARKWLGHWRSEVDPAALVAAAGVLAIVAADLSGLSKAETERIWLPFEVWALAGTALLPRDNQRGWLAVQAVGTLLIAHLILTNW
ncbi:hypothetical protein [Nocardia inohanensis]|uniref:hypothetical protein n=1 Tax=Nocardia inohanensis TaxID=209246 RepID=UPI000A033213|nr:hypothetical protein [Nocardia inohanensis]